MVNRSLSCSFTIYISHNTAVESMFVMILDSIVAIHDKVHSIRDESDVT